MSEVKLRECPFCCSKDIFLDEYNHQAIGRKEKYYKVICPICDVYRAKSEAIEAWNRRKGEKCER